MRIDSGDITDMNRVSKTLAFMKKNKDCDIAYSDWYLQDGPNKKLNILPLKILKEDLIYRNKIAHSTISLESLFFKNITLTILVLVIYICTLGQLKIFTYFNI